MSINQYKWGRLFSAIFLMGGFLSIPFIFNSCGEGPQYSGAHNADLTKLRVEAASSQAISPEVSQCLSSYSYVCEQHIYSPDVSEGQSIKEFKCVDVGDGQLCVTGLSIGHDSTSAYESCESQDCRSSYDYEEYRCYNSKVLYNGVYIVDAISDSLDEALGSAYEQCLGLQGSN